MNLAATMDAMTEDELRARGSLKWTGTPAGVIAAWVAEMDMPPAPAITAVLADAVARGITGYLPDWAADECAAACARWQARYGRTVDPANVHLVADVLTALRISISCLSPAGAPIVLPLPAYMPFLDLPGLVGRPLRTVPMTLTGGRYTFDLAAIGAALSPGAVFVLTNPHNPAGRVFSRQELADLAAVVEEAGALVFSDEIHAPLVLSERPHVPYALVSPAAAAHSVTAVSASKGWNIPGLCCAQVIMEPGYRSGSWDDVPFLMTHGVSPLGALAARAAYTNGADHLAACLDYLRAGADLFAAALATALPTARFTPPEGTYLGWLDLRDTGLDPATLPASAGVQGVDGAACGTPGFLRVNLAMPHPMLAEVARRLGAAAAR